MTTAHRRARQPDGAAAPPERLTSAGATGRDLDGATPDQLRLLLRAYQLIGVDLPVPLLLQRVAQAACEIVDARCCSITMADGVGIDEIYNGQPPELDADGRAGVAPGGALHVPVLVDGAVFANVYLSEPAHGTFSANDRHLILALAAAAAAAIEKRSLHDHARQGQTWLQASSQMTRQILSFGAGDPLDWITSTAKGLADASVAAIITVDGPDLLRMAMTTGPYEGVSFTRDSFIGRAIVSGTAGRYASFSDIARAGAENSYGIGPVMLAPLSGNTDLLGVLALARAVGDKEFTDSELDMATTFANHIALAMELAAARQDAARAELLEERSRIAREVQDTVIQRLFGIGLGLESTAAAVHSTVARGKIAGYVSDLDETISKIRAAIFGA